MYKKTHILFFHGNAENVSSHFHSLFWILEQGYSYTIFDYPGYGGSEGEPTPRTTTLSGQFMINYIAKTYHDSKIFVFGQSLGGNIALYSSIKMKFKAPICGIAVESTFLSYRAIARRVLAKNWFTWLFQALPYILVSDTFSASENLSELSPIPLLIFHGNKDPVVGIENGKELYDSAVEPKRFTLVQNGEHIDSFRNENRALYQDELIKFIRQNCEY